MGGINREQLLEYIDTISLSLYDTVLFLDTHPDNMQALEYFEKLKMLRLQATREYTMRFGPLMATDVNNRNYWTWVNDPWPWERGC